MGTPATFDLERALATWRSYTATARGLLQEDLDELETHLRDEIEAALAEGCSEEAAYKHALHRMGGYAMIEASYGAVFWHKLRGEGLVVHHLIHHAAMLKNYLKITLRNLRRHKGYTFINICGLAVGLACCILILLYVKDELSFDRFHEHAEQIYRVNRERRVQGSDLSRIAQTNYQLGPLLRSDFPQILETARLSQHRFLVTYQDKQFSESRFFMADPSLFDVFSFTFVRGEPEQALTQPYTVVLTEETAQRYFGDADPMGQLIMVNNTYPYTVTGVVEGFPEASHVHFDFLGSLESTRGWFGSNMFDAWGAVWVYTYLLLPEGTDPALLENQLPAFLDRRATRTYQSTDMRLTLQALTDIHLRSDVDGEIEPTGDIAFLYLFLTIAGLILLIACINFMNLATARSTERSKEVGVRKVVGAHRLQLVQQFLSESLLLSLASLGLALLLVLLLLSPLNAFTGKTLHLDLAADLYLGLALLGLTLLVGVLAGSYPALYLSAFRPALVLKGTAAKGGSPAAARLRKGLVIVQFAICIALLIGTAVVYNQLRFVRNQKLGFDQEHIIVVQLNNPEARSNYERLKAAFVQHPTVLKVSATSSAPPDGLNSWSIAPEGASLDQQSSIRVMAVDYDFLETLGIQLAEGRALSRDFPTDAETAILINQEMVRQHGLEAPLGTRFNLMDNLKQGEVVGVVEDFHLTSLHEEIRPVFLHIWPSWYNKLLVKVRPTDVQTTLAFLEDQWAGHMPEWPFQYTFMDERFDALYRAEVQLGQLVGAFALLTVFIACLGLFGLASFTAEQRTKEIGIRKVFGASIPNLIALLSRDFLKLIALAFLIAAPAAYLLMNAWLQDFAYRTSVGVGTLLATGLLAVLITLLTVSYQSIKAALANPIETLRYE